MQVAQTSQVITPYKVWKFCFIPPTFSTRLLCPTIGSLKIFLTYLEKQKHLAIGPFCLPFPKVHSLEFTGLANSVVIITD